MAKTKHALARSIVVALARHGVEWPGGPENARIQRTFAGHHQRAAGAWSWCLAAVHPTFGIPSIGSQFPAREIARGFTLWEDRYGDCHLDPAEPEEATRGED